jgi:hypothetical protein
MELASEAYDHASTASHPGRAVRGLRLQASSTFAGVIQLLEPEHLGRERFEFGRECFESKHIEREFFEPDGIYPRPASEPSTASLWLGDSTGGRN